MGKSDIAPSPREAHPAPEREQTTDQAGDAQNVVEQEIGTELRRMFEDVANEPLPDRFRDLLDRLKQESGDGDA